MVNGRVVRPAMVKVSKKQIKSDNDKSQNPNDK